MKEKIKNIVKNKYFKIIILILLGLFVLREVYAVYIDMYNFRQLEKAKPYLETIGENDKKFYTLKDFNEKYDAGIKPIKNCYVISNDNGDEKYIFGFQLESIIYKFIHFGENYAYPSYDLPSGGINCVMYHCEYNTVWKGFVRKIAEPCKD